jgi:hypothetical protein
VAINGKRWTGEVVNDEEHQGDDAASPAEAIRRHCRGIKTCLRAIEMTTPAAAPVLNRMRETCDNLNIDLGELSYFLRSER